MPTRTPVRPIVQTPVPTFAAMAEPTWIDIARIDVHAPIIKVGVKPDGEIEAPPGPREVGWLHLTPRPGDPGNSFLTGHLDFFDRTAVFWRLKEVVLMDTISILTQTASVEFTVESTDLYPTETAPLAKILGYVVGRVITIVSCEGTFDRATRDYSHRRVVRARLV